MSLTSVERAIRLEAQGIFQNRKLRNKDIMEWSTGEIAARDDEVTVYLPEAGVWVAIKKELDKRG